MTDSIEAAAVRATGTTEQVAVRSIRAGNDIVLTTGQRLVDPRLPRAARRGARVALVPRARARRPRRASWRSRTRSLRTSVRSLRGG